MLEERNTRHLPDKTVLHATPTIEITMLGIREATSWTTSVSEGLVKSRAHSLRETRSNTASIPPIIVAKAIPTNTAHLARPGLWAPSSFATRTLLDNQHHRSVRIQVELSQVSWSERFLLNKKRPTFCLPPNGWYIHCNRGATKSVNLQLTPLLLQAPMATWSTTQSFESCQCPQLSQI